MVELDIPHDTKMWVEVSYIAKLQADYKELFERYKELWKNSHKVVISVRGIKRLSLGKGVPILRPYKIVSVEEAPKEVVLTLKGLGISYKEPLVDESSYRALCNKLDEVTTQLGEKLQIERSLKETIKRVTSEKEDINSQYTERIKILTKKNRNLTRISWAIAIIYFLTLSLITVL